MWWRHSVMFCQSLCISDFLLQPWSHLPFEHKVLNISYFSSTFTCNQTSNKNRNKDSIYFGNPSITLFSSLNTLRTFSFFSLAKISTWGSGYNSSYQYFEDSLHLNEQNVKKNKNETKRQDFFCRFYLSYIILYFSTSQFSFPIFCSKNISFCSKNICS